MHPIVDTAWIKSERRDQKNFGSAIGSRNDVEISQPTGAKILPHSASNGISGERNSYNLNQ